MKRLHRSDLFAWSAFDEERNIDFNSICWVRAEGNVLIDPLPLSSHDLEHLETLGGVRSIVVTNSDHLRDAGALSDRFGAELLAPFGEKGTLVASVERWLRDGDEVAPGLLALSMEGTKTPGELALVLDDTTLITGDLVRAHQAGMLMMLPESKLEDLDKAVASIERLAQLEAIEAVLVGDGWSLFHNGHQHLRALLESLRS